MKLDQTVVQITFIQMYLRIVQGYITRLDNCKYSANFTTILENKYFQGTVGKTKVGPLTRDQCSALCLGDKTCVFYNHKMDGTACELMTSHVGELIDLIGWRYATTDYTDFRYQGPLCKYLQIQCEDPFSLKPQACFDKCSTPGFICSHVPSIISSRHYTIDDSTKSKSSQPNTNLIDNKAGTYWATEGSSLKGWFTVKINKMVAIYNVRLVNRKDQQNERKWIKVTISRNKQNWEKCGQDIKIKGFYVDVPCENGPIVGKYVKVARENSIDQFTVFGEILLFGHH